MRGRRPENVTDRWHGTLREGGLSTYKRRNEESLQKESIVQKLLRRLLVSHFKVEQKMEGL